MTPTKPELQPVDDALHAAVMDLAWQARFLPAERRDAFHRPLNVIAREASRLRRERDRNLFRAALFRRLVGCRLAQLRSLLNTSMT